MEQVTSKQETQNRSPHLLDDLWDLEPSRHNQTRLSLRQQTTARSHSLLFKQGAIAGLWSDKLSTGFCIFSAASAPEGRRCGRSSIA